MIKKYPELLVIGTLLAATLYYLFHYEVSLVGTNLALGLKNGDLSQAQSKSIDIILDLSHLMMAWTVAIIGATAFLLRAIVESNIPINRVDLVFLFCSVLSCVVSLYFGHLGIYNIAEMLSLEQYPIGNKNDTEIFSRQYFALVTATGLFSFHMVVFVWRLAAR